MEMHRGAATSRVEYRVGPVRDIPEGGGVLVVAGGTEVGVFRVRDAIHAYENRCMHQGGPACTGEIVGGDGGADAALGGGDELRARRALRCLRRPGCPGCPGCPQSAERERRMG